MLIDTHAHLEMFPHLDQVITTTHAAGVSHIITVGTTLHLPLIIHNREAHHHILQPIKQTNQKLARQLPLTGVFHCFSGDETFLNQILQLGFYVSFAGNLTYPSSLQLQKLAPLVPSHKLLIETDAPLLPPEPLRSSLNQLAHSNEDRTKFYKIGSCVKIKS